MVAQQPSFPAPQTPTPSPTYLHHHLDLVSVVVLPTDVQQRPDLDVRRSPLQRPARLARVKQQAVVGGGHRQPPGEGCADHRTGGYAQDQTCRRSCWCPDRIAGPCQVARRQPDAGGGGKKGEVRLPLRMLPLCCGSDSFLDTLTQAEHICTGCAEAVSVSLRVRMSVGLGQGVRPPDRPAARRTAPAQVTHLDGAAGSSLLW